MLLSLADARRITLAAQGFGQNRPARPGARHIRQVLGRLGVVQLDFVNAVAPAHYQVLFSRLGPYDRATFDAVAYRGEFTEQWAHEASLVPVSTWPLLRHRREAHRLRPYGFERVMEQIPDYAAGILDRMRERGPLCAADLPTPEGTDRRMPGVWFTVPRAVMEAHFGRGLLAVAARRRDFARIFDLAERVIPPAHYGCRLEREEQQRQLLLIGARAHGIATAADLADYFRMPVRDARPRLEELIAAGELRQLRVEGWREPAFLDPAAPEPRPVTAACLLSPFDPLIWTRPRVSRLFGFEYRVEIFVPQARRRWGFYVLPFLFQERLAARVDLKAVRTGRRLLVPGAWLETGCNGSAVAEALARELRLLAGWLNLDDVQIGTRGNLARRLSAAVA